MLFDNLVFYRVAVAFSLAGIALLCCTIGLILRERKNGIFSRFNIFCGGLLFGISSVCLKNSHAESLYFSSQYISFVTALSFLLTLLVHSGLSSSVTENSDDEIALWESAMDPTDDDEIELMIRKDASEVSAHQKDESAIRHTSKRQSKVRYSVIPEPSAAQYMCISLFTTIGASFCGMLDAISLSSQLHEGYTFLVVAFISRVYLSLALGNALSMHKHILLFVLPFSLSSPIGIILGIFIDRVEYAMIFEFIECLVSGAFLYIVALTILPAELRHTQDLYIRIMVFILGFALSSSSCAVLNMNAIQ